MTSSISPAPSISSTPATSLQTTVVVSTSDLGVRDYVPGYRSSFVSVSYDGHLVAFTTSDALEVSDTNGKNDVYVKNLDTGLLRRVSLASDGSQLNSGSGSVSMSADGRFFAFSSLASNLIAGDNNQTTDIFVKDLQTGAVRLVSGNESGVGNGSSADPIISADGHFVTFVSKATNFAAGTTQDVYQVYLKNLDSGALSLVSSSSDGIAASAQASVPTISADGHYVAFSSSARNLVPGIDFTANRTYIKDTQTGALSSLFSDANKIYSNYSPQFSADGKSLAFNSGVKLADADINGHFDVYVKDLQSGDYHIVSPSDQPGRDYGYARAMSISADGSRVAFVGYNADFAGNNTFSNQPQVYVRDLRNGVTLNLSQTVNGLQSTVLTGNPVISGDGKSVLLVSNSAHSGSPASLIRVALPDTLTAPVGEDRFDDHGAAGQSFVGGTGDDLYVLSNAGTVVTELAAQGNDRLVTLVDNTTLPLNVEQLTLSGANAFHGIGNAQDNWLRGNSNDNLLEGLGGNDTFFASEGIDTIDGGSGFDKLVFELQIREAFEIKHTSTPGKFTLQISGDQSMGMDTLINIERLQFAESNLALDIDGVAGQAYRIYQAAFGRVPDQAGLGYWIAAMDKGVSLNEVAKDFVQSQEFQTLYGANASHSDIVNRMYQNVLHRTPDAGGAGFWVNVLDHNQATVAEVLQQFSESPENKVALVGATQNGIDYIPYA